MITHAQIITTQGPPPRKQKIKPPKKHQSQSNAQAQQNPLTAVVKFVSDADADLYIDGVKVATLQKDSVFRKNLNKGEYISKAVSTANSSDFVVQNITVNETGVEKLQNFSLQQVITQNSIAAEARSIVFNDDFSFNKNNWYEDNKDQFAFRIVNGKYSLISKKGGSWVSTIPVNLNQQKNFEISADIRKVSGTDGYYFGLMLGNDKSTGFYHLAGITGNGDYVFANHGGAPGDLIPTARNTVVNKGNQLNNIKVRRIGNTIQLYVNDHLTGETAYQPFYGGDFGFKMWSGNQYLEIEVDYLKIRYIP